MWGLISHSYFFLQMPHEKVAKYFKIDLIKIRVILINTDFIK